MVRPTRVPGRTSPAPLSTKRASSASTTTIASARRWVTPECRRLTVPGPVAHDRLAVTTRARCPHGASGRARSVHRWCPGGDSSLVGPAGGAGRGVSFAALGPHGEHRPPQEVNPGLSVGLFAAFDAKPSGDVHGNSGLGVRKPRNAQPCVALFQNRLVVRTETAATFGLLVLAGLTALAATWRPISEPRRRRGVRMVSCLGPRWLGRGQSCGSMSSVGLVVVAFGRAWPDRFTSRWLCRRGRLGGRWGDRAYDRVAERHGDRLSVMGDG